MQVSNELVCLYHTSPSVLTCNLNLVWDIAANLNNAVRDLLCRVYVRAALLLVRDVSLAVSDPMAGRLGDGESRGYGDWPLFSAQKGGGGFLGVPCLRRLLVFRWGSG